MHNSNTNSSAHFKNLTTTMRKGPKEQTRTNLHEFRERTVKVRLVGGVSDDADLGARL